MYLFFLSQNVFESLLKLSIEFFSFERFLHSITPLRTGSQSYVALLTMTLCFLIVTQHFNHFDIFPPIPFAAIFYQSEMWYFIKGLSKVKV